MSGFYLMHRGWMDNPAFSDEKFTERLAWAWMIEQASYEPHKIRYHNDMIEVGRGEIPTSYRKLKEAWKWSNDRVRSFLNLLDSEKMITRKIGTGFLVITICNYDKYQSPYENIGTPSGTHTGTVAGTTSGTNIKKDKEIKEIKEEERGGEIPEEKNSEALVAIWNEVLGESCSKVKYLTAERKNFLAARMKKYFKSEDGWRSYCLAIRGSPFCLGENNRGWRANIDWALREKTIIGVQEGSYGKHGNANRRTKFDDLLEGTANAVLGNGNLGIETSNRPSSGASGEDSRHRIGFTSDAGEPRK